MHARVVREERGGRETDHVWQVALSTGWPGSTVSLCSVTSHGSYGPWRWGNPLTTARVHYDLSPLPPVLPHPSRPFLPSFPPLSILSLFLLSLPPSLPPYIRLWWVWCASVVSVSLYMQESMLDNEPHLPSNPPHPPSPPLRSGP